MGNLPEIKSILSYLILSLTWGGGKCRTMPNIGRTNVGWGAIVEGSNVVDWTRYNVLFCYIISVFF